ncbi:DarT ssDNA thymidine ADP-ribosyltransferase family protein [Cryobacterium sp. HLT2-28]|uniref:DarT ssDNA thymidine ADP-ribosyltransferase family protein n=1 Tax=Cryobacterium sp. HLT2-28 TaxID=1259146 RepID=UPI00141B416F|nr:DarT ssDNA thymidine ADP-ribosyltransferase family protein [Cryobacterium sp. HLT2-28]
MSDECIHGLEGGLCALCFPKAAPQIAATVPAPRASRAKASRAPSLRSSPSPRTVTLGAPKPPVATRVVGAAKVVADNVGEQRIYHLTHIRNLAGILESGALLADTSEAWTTRPVVDISSAPNRDARRTALVSGDGSSSVAGYVPFFLSPNARLWDGLLTGTTDPRLSADAHTAEIFDFVILVSTVKKLRDAQAAAEDAADASGASDAAVAVTDGDAAGALTRISATPETSDSLLRRLRADAESDGILRAELLVAETFPFDLVTLVGVANDKVRDEVRGILAASTHKPKVAVYPPWFHAVEATTAL